ncbi:MerR family transcriptional regulator [Gloeobacter kilaueensis]|uniref:MerR family transcriptional regulator n=1 Tax=Gloeobacter kilaueensis (strain ATCC BAA-2537 / CCAP 1431/1 / ULC 316 / JS1) TaxID=1183438 RepID=U5QJE2_GLOK1|nr:helix-turn-helix transcriptional regulator [Gloeobacter kilaueensis]AGY57790.1 MerR family transcriptional regulator [Gloeobacter kilaueensis JS1]
MVHFDDPRDRPVYIISVAAELVGMHPQTLRQYERAGLIRPYRMPGRGEGKNGKERETRLYSERDVEQLLYIKRLTQELKVNLEGVKQITMLKDEIEQRQRELDKQRQKMQQEIHRLRSKIGQLEVQMEEES